MSGIRANVCLPLNVVSKDFSRGILKREGGSVLTRVGDPSAYHDASWESSRQLFAPKDFWTSASAKAGEDSLPSVYSGIQRWSRLVLRPPQKRLKRTDWTD